MAGCPIQLDRVFFALPILPGPLVAVGQHYVILLTTNIDIPDRVTFARPPPIERETALQKAISLQSPNVELEIFASDTLRSVTSTAAISTHASLLDSPKSLGKSACFQIAPAVATSLIGKPLIYAFYSPSARFYPMLVSCSTQTLTCRESIEE
jgi:hypothetical protein